MNGWKQVQGNGAAQLTVLFHMAVPACQTQVQFPPQAGGGVVPVVVVGGGVVVVLVPQVPPRLDGPVGS